MRKHVRVKVGTPKECTPHVCVSTHVHARERSDRSFDKGLEAECRASEASFDS